MLSKKYIKNYIVIAVISILIYKIIDNPRIFLNGIGSIAKFFCPFLIAIFLSLIINPLVMFFERHLHTRRMLNILFAYVIIVAVVFMIFKIIVPATINTLTNLIHDVPNYVDFVNRTLEDKVAQEQFFEATLPRIQDSLNNFLSNGLYTLTNISSNLAAYIFSIASVMLDTIMGIILSIYILADKEKLAVNFKRLMYACFTKDRTDRTVEFFLTAHDIFYHYLLGTFIEASIVGIIVFLGLQFVFKVDNAFFFGFVAFITDMIPYFGPFIGAFFPIAMTLVYSPVKAFWIAVFILILQQVDGNIIGPKVVGNKVGLSPLCIITAVLVGGGMFGVVGLFLSIPTAALLNIYLKNFIDKRLFGEKN
ncbi:MAG: AI-2E family transporter [Clostridioides sp.]|jgi:predicted PurR-regulated permease PerM|nr:AI-2E family transporter [Clostridioides sp.]